MTIEDDRRFAYADSQLHVADVRYTAYRNVVVLVFIHFSLRFSSVCIELLLDYSIRYSMCIPSIRKSWRKLSFGRGL